MGLSLVMRSFLLNGFQVSVIRDQIMKKGSRSKEQRSSNQKHPGAKLRLRINQAKPALRGAGNRCTLLPRSRHRGLSPVMRLFRPAWKS